MLNTTYTQPISKQSDTTCYPIYPSRGGQIVLDSLTVDQERFYQIMVGTTGSIVVQLGNVVRYYPLVLAGALYPIAGDKILTNGTVDGVAVTTTATNIWWYGGK